MTVKARQGLPAAAPAGARAIMEALQRHYRKPGTARDGEILIPEVAAPGSSRRADLVRVGMWASRGTGIDVHEIKTSRGDWLRELDDPAKAEAWWPYCNRFWLVTPPGLVPPTELPEGWGLMEAPPAGRRRFKVAVQAATRTDISLTVPLLVQLLRRADNLRLAEIDNLRYRHRDEIRRLELQWMDRQAQGELSPATRKRLTILEQIEAAIGMPLDTWRGWPQQPPSKVTPDELAAFLADAAAHVSVQRRRDDLEQDTERLRRAAADVLKQLDGEGPG